ncbi:MAG: hypothetical protein EXR79_07080 [Myxococcales bacterium]|nr:hypothetical protein [Myxococcales bacterium]
MACNLSSCTWVRRVCRAVPHRVARAVAVLACGSVALPAPASAHNVDGKIGIGFEETLTGLESRLGTLAPLAVPAIGASGLAVRGFVGNVGIEGVFGANFHLPDRIVDAQGETLNDDPALELGAFLSAGVFYNLFRAPQVNLAIGGRALVGVARINRDDGAWAPWTVGVAFEAPLRVEWFFNPAFAIGGAVGAVLTVATTRAHPLTGRRESSEFSLTRGDFSGGVGFMYYFN